MRSFRCTQDDSQVVDMNNKGSTLVFLVIVIALIIVLGASVLNVVMRQYEIKMFNTDDRQSYYMSETGLNEAYVKSCVLINESISESLQDAEEYLFINPLNEIEAENIFDTGYKLNIESKIKSRIETAANPSVETRNDVWVFDDNELTISVRSSYINQNNVAKLTWVDLIISVPEFDDVLSGMYDAKDYIEFANWNS